MQRITVFCCRTQGISVAIAMAIGDVAVCVCVPLMYCAQTTESMIMRPSPDCSLAVPVSRTKYELDSSRGFPSFRASNVVTVAWRLLAITFIQAFGWHVCHSWASCSTRMSAIPTVSCSFFCVSVFVFWIRWTCEQLTFQRPLRTTMCY